VKSTFSLSLWWFFPSTIATYFLPACYRLSVATNYIDFIIQREKNTMVFTIELGLPTRLCETLNSP